MGFWTLKMFLEWGFVGGGELGLARSGNGDGSGVWERRGGFEDGQFLGFKVGLEDGWTGAEHHGKRLHNHLKLGEREREREDKGAFQLAPNKLNMKKNIKH
jgi:hypothetical protein